MTGKVAPRHVEGLPQVVEVSLWDLREDREDSQAGLLMDHLVELNLDHVSLSERRRRVERIQTYPAMTKVRTNLTLSHGPSEMPSAFPTPKRSD